jgi:hypothetical protein
MRKKRRRPRNWYRLKPSYSTKVHLKRHLFSTDWRFVGALIALLALLTASILYLA